MNDIALLKTLHIQREKHSSSKKRAAVYPNTQIAFKQAYTVYTIFLNRNIFWFTMFCSLLKLGFFLYGICSAFCLSSTNVQMKYKLYKQHANTHTDDAIHLLCIFWGLKVIGFSKNDLVQAPIACAFQIQTNESRIVCECEKKRHTHAHARTCICDKLNVMQDWVLRVKWDTFRSIDDPFENKSFQVKFEC